MRSKIELPRAQSADGKCSLMAREEKGIMSKLQRFLAQRQDTILLLLLAGGFAVVLGELVLYQHWEGTQLIGFSATVVGMLAVLAGIFVKGTLRTVIGLLLVVLSISGLIGAREHLAEGGEAMSPRPALVQQSTLTGVQEIAYRPGGLAQERRMRKAKAAKAARVVARQSRRPWRR
jgi:hypothetical protein